MARKPKAEFQITAQDKSGAQMRQAEKRLKQVTSNVKTFALATTGALVGLGAVLVRTTKQLDTVAKAAKSAGVGAEVFQAWEFAASQAGVAQAQFISGLDRFNKTIGDASQGVGEAVEVFDFLGVSVRDVEGNVRSGEDVLRDVADAIQGLKSPAEQAAAASDLFGRTAGPKLVGLLKQGSDGLKAYEDRARELGIVISGETLENAEKLTDKMDELSRVINAQTAEGILGNAEAIESLGEAFGLIVKNTVGAVAGATNVVKFLAEEVAARVGGIAANDLPRLIGAVNDAKADLERFLELQSRSIVPEKFDARIAEQRELVAQAEKRVQLAIRLNSIEAEARRNKAEPAAAAAAEPIAAGETGAEKKAREERAAAEIKFQERLMASISTLREARTAERLANEERLYQESLARSAGFENAAAQERFAKEEQLFLARMEANARRFEEELAQELGFKDARDQAIQEAERAHQDALLAIRIGDAGGHEKLIADLAKFEEKTARQKTQFVLGQAQTLTAGLAQSSKTLFNINKAAAIADAVINTAQGVTKALASVPYPLNIAAAAAVAAAGAAQIATISSTQFGGASSGITSRGPGTGVPSLANDIAPPPTVSAEERNQSTIRLVIDTGDSEIARTIFKSARAVADDEDDILFSGRSRQAFELST